MVRGELAGRFVMNTLHLTTQLPSPTRSIKEFGHGSQVTQTTLKFASVKCGSLGRLFVQLLTHEE